MKERIFEIARHYGFEPQSRQLIEEMSELIMAINKFWRTQLECGRKPFPKEPTNSVEEDNIIEEIADVEIMLEQLKFFFGCHDEVESWKEEKIKRQLERINRYE